MSPRSKTTVRRLAFRLVVIVLFAALWPGASAASATAILCGGLGAAVLAAAVAHGEPFLQAGLNRWHEAAVLFVVACLVLLWR